MGLGKMMKRGLRRLGVDTKAIGDLKLYPRFRRDRQAWLKQGGDITRTTPMLKDFGDQAGTAKGDYFHQDLLVASFVFQNQPNRHIDIGSRIDGFVAHVAAFREIEVFDVRPLSTTGHPNIIFRQADLMRTDEEQIADSVSCLHTIEHFGLGRYSDPIDVDGHKKGISNLIRMLKPGGLLYISFPISQQDEVHFNANRIFHPQTLLSLPDVKKYMQLERFDYVDNHGDLHLEADLGEVARTLRSGCGIYTMKRHS